MSRTKFQSNDAVVQPTEDVVPSTQIDERLDKQINELIDEFQAQIIAWDIKFNGKPYYCQQCGSQEFWQYRINPEIRKCQWCYFQTRLRKGTLFEHSKVPLRDWMRAIRYYFEHGASARVHGLKNHLGYKSYAKSWALFMKIRAEKKMLAKFFCKGEGDASVKSDENAGRGGVMGTLSE